MALVRWRNRGELAPWSALRDMESQFSRLFNELTQDWDSSGRAWMPAVDMQETEDAFLVEVDLPGMTKQDISLEVVDNVVTIKGERKSERKEDDKGYHRVERRQGSFQRSFEIPGGFDSAKVEAGYEDGVLKVRLPKREEAKPKVIEVKVK